MFRVRTSRGGFHVTTNACCRAYRFPVHHCLRLAIASAFVITRLRAKTQKARRGVSIEAIPESAFSTQSPLGDYWLLCFRRDSAAFLAIALRPFGGRL